jgi:serine/threonine-protein kinase
MSPEQARGSKVDPRADVFSAGVMLWEALTGRRTREGQNEQEKLWALVAADLPRASSVKPTVPAELDEICARAMAWDRDERYQSAGELQADLERYLAASGTNVTARDVGAWVSELFREDRARTSALIEAHVAHARTAGSRDDVPVIEVTARSGGGRTPSDPRVPAMTPGLRAPDDSPTAPSAEVSAAAPSGPRRVELLRARAPMMIAGAAFAATFAGLVVFAWPSAGDKQEPAARLAVAPPGSPPAAARSAAAPAPAAAVPPAAPAAASPATEPRQPAQAAPAPPPPLIASQVSVEIRVSPANARLTIDDTAILGNPFVGNFRGDRAVHHLRASAPGYISKSLPFELDANVSLDLSLEREAAPVRIVSPARRAPVPVHAPPTPPPPPPPRTDAPSTASTAGLERPPPREPPPAAIAAQPGPAAQQPATAAATEVDPAGGSQPRRPIDPKDPYSGQGGPP